MASSNQSSNQSANQSTGATQSTGYSQQSAQSSSTSFIPNFSQTPILESIAQYAENMAPQVYQWGMNQWGKNQGDIQQLLDTGRSYASPQRIAADMGQAEAGVAMAGEKGLQAARADLQSYGIDPSSGRYAELEAGERVQNAAAAAGAGNMQRNADIATGQALTQAGVSAEMQNMGYGIQGEQAANAYLSTGMQLKYPPLGQMSQSSSQGSSANQSTGYNQSSGWSEGGSSGSSTDPAHGGGGGGGGGEKSPGGGQQGGGGGGPSGGGGGGGSRGGGGSGGGGLGGGGGGYGGGGGGYGGGGGGGTDPWGNPIPYDPNSDPYWNTNSNELPYDDPYYDPYGAGGTEWGGQDTEWAGGGFDPYTSDTPSWDGSWDSSPENTYTGDTWYPSDSGGGGDSWGGGGEGGFEYFAKGGTVGYDGGAVDQSMSPSRGARTDDVPAKIDGKHPARLNTDEFVIPKDVALWKGQEFFHNLIQQSRKKRVTAGSQNPNYNMGGAI